MPSNRLAKAQRKFSLQGSAAYEILSPDFLSALQDGDVFDVDDRQRAKVVFDRALEQVQAFRVREIHHSNQRVRPIGPGQPQSISPLDRAQHVLSMASALRENGYFNLFAGDGHRRLAGKPVYCGPQGPAPACLRISRASSG
jgi:hypothetical protein